MALIQAITQKLRPNPAGNPDNQPSPQGVRAGKYSELHVLSMVRDSHMLADEGSYFSTTNPTPLTAIAGPATVTTYAGSDTAGTMVIKNNAALGSGIRVYLDYLRLILVALPTTATNFSFAWTLDQASSNKYTSGGSTLTPVNVNMDDNTQPNAIVYFGNLTTAAKTAQARLVSLGAWKPRATATPVAVLGDEVVFKCGGVEQASANPQIQLAAGTPTLVTRNVVHVPPIILGPQQFAQLGLFGTANAGTPSYELEMGHWER